ncbi:MAG: type IV secretion system protein [Synergistaceae bacterium]|jgi:hypothetical protein|nr:type IV secretion system protein [Synergistaceae bacterium]
MKRAVNPKRIVLAGIAILCMSLPFCITSPAHAQLGATAMGDLYVSIMNACKGWLQKAGEIALKLLAVTAVIGFAIGIKDLVLAGNLTMDGIVALLVRYAFIVGLLTWLLSAPQRLATIPASIKKMGSTISGQDISFGGLMDLFGEVTTPLVDFTTGLGWMDVGLIICMTFVIFLINCLFFMIASTVLVVEVEAVFILIGGLFTASFFVIGYFRDAFLSYIKALAAVGVKMLMLCLCLGVMRNIMSAWPDMIVTHLENAESVFSFLMPMACALLGFYMLAKAVPQFASSVMTGSVSGMDGGMIRAAAAAGYGLGMTIVNTSGMAARKMIGGASVVSQAAQTYAYTSKAALDTGSTQSEAKRAGAWEAFKTVMTGPQPGGPRAAGDRMYADAQRTNQYADVRNGGDSNSLSSPNATPAPASDGSAPGGSAGSSGKSGSAPSGSGAGGAVTVGSKAGSSVNTPVNASVFGKTNGERISSAGPYVSPSSQSSGFAPSVNEGRAAEMNKGNRASAEEAVESYGYSETDVWGSYESERRENRGEGANGQ